MKLKSRLCVLIILSIILVVSCGKDKKENPTEIEQHQNNTQDTVTKQPLQEIPEINEMSRLGFTFIHEKQSGDDENSTINVYDNLTDNKNTKTIDQNSDVWVNVTTNRNRYQIYFSKDLWGFVDRKNINLYPRGEVNIKSGKLNLRKGKSINTEVIKGLEMNQTVFITDISNKDWYHIKTFNGESGYVSSKYLRFIDKRTNLFQGISQKDFTKYYTEIKNRDYMLIMNDYRLQAMDKYIARSDFNNGGNIDKAFLSLKNNSNTISLVVWNAESNTYVIVDSFDIPSFLGVEVFPKDDNLESVFENNPVNMVSDGISLVFFDKGDNYIYYWNGREYKKFIYNK